MLISAIKKVHAFHLITEENWKHDTYLFVRFPLCFNYFCLLRGKKIQRQLICFDVEKLKIAINYNGHFLVSYFLLEHYSSVCACLEN